MKQKIDELIEKYKIGLEGAWLIADPQMSGTMHLLHEIILSDLEELKKLAEVNSKLTDFVNSQEPMPADFKKVVDENFWELV